MKTSIFTVVYPGMETYFLKFLDSLCQQSCKDFTLFLVNDGLENIMDYLEKKSLRVKVKDVETRSPAEIRKIGIQWIMQSDTEVIIFADSDDYFAGNRVEIIREMIECYDLVFHELVLTGQGIPEPKPMIGERFKEGDRILSTHIKTLNCLGLSNTAIRVKSIPMHFEKIPNDIIAFDWTFFSFCLHEGAKGVHTKKTTTFYRQHGKNISSIYSLEDEQILKGVRVKRDHYKTLAEFYEEYLPLAEKFKNLLEKLKSDINLRKEYCQTVRKNAPPMPLWWEPIKTLEDVGL